MSGDAFDRVSYLTQISQIVAGSGNHTEAQLSAFYGHSSREICLKHQILSFGFDSIKRNRCKKCFIHLVDRSTCSFKTKNKCFIVSCNNCGTKKKIAIQRKRKTRFERMIFGEEESNGTHVPTDSTSNESRNESPSKRPET